MQNDELLISYEKVAKDGDTLIKNGKIIKDNVVSINNLITKKWTNWEGKDSTAFVFSLQENLKKVTEYANEVCNVGKYLQNESDDFLNIINVCIKELNQDE